MYCNTYCTAGANAEHIESWSLTLETVWRRRTLVFCEKSDERSFHHWGASEHVYTLGRDALALTWAGIEMFSSDPGYKSSDARDAENCIWFLL